MSANAVNPCAGRYAGCTAAPPVGKTMCDHCRAIHNANERRRRAERRKARACSVCGDRAVVVDGVALTTCKRHREYYRARAVKP